LFARHVTIIAHVHLTVAKRGVASRRTSGTAGDAFAPTIWVVMRDGQIEVTTTLSGPTRELLSWLALKPRTYEEAIDAWRSHCPRLTVWEDAVIDGLIRIERTRGAGSTVALTERADAMLRAEPSPRRPMERS
jgi:hypothetical protein